MTSARFAIPAIAALMLCGHALAETQPATTPESPPPTATMQPVDPNAPQLPARIDDGSRIKLPPMVVSQDRPPVDRRPIYLGMGLVVLAAVFWWNRRRRDRFEREDHGTPPARPERSRDADADADDLHAAARGDGPQPADPDEPEGPEPR
jgi:hypothetical protein